MRELSNREIRKPIIGLLITFCFLFSISYAAECILDIPFSDGPEKIVDKSQVKRKIYVVGKSQWIKSGTASFLAFDGKTDRIVVDPDNLKMQKFSLSQIGRAHV